MAMPVGKRIWVNTNSIHSVGVAVVLTAVARIRVSFPSGSPKQRAKALLLVDCKLDVVNGSYQEQPGIHAWATYAQITHHYFQIVALESLLSLFHASIHKNLSQTCHSNSTCP